MILLDIIAAMIIPLALAGAHTLLFVGEHFAPEWQRRQREEALPPLAPLYLKESAGVEQEPLYDEGEPWASYPLADPEQEEEKRIRRVKEPPIFWASFEYDDLPTIYVCPTHPTCIEIYQALDNTRRRVKWHTTSSLRLPRKKYYK